MDEYLLNDDMYQPARSRFFRRLSESRDDKDSDSRFITPEEERGSLSVSMMALRYFSRFPWRFFFLASELFEYMDFKSNINYLYYQAEKVVNEANEELARTIIKNACLSLERENRREWPEISGLAAQKLAHLRYHEDMLKKKNKVYSGNTR